MPPFSWSALAVALAVPLTLGAGFTLLRRFRPWESNPSPARAVPLAIRGSDLLGFLAILLLAARELGGFWFSFVGLVGVILILKLNGKSGAEIARRFGAGTLSLPAVLGWSLWIEAAIYLPLQCFSGGIEALFHYAHWPTPPEPAIALFLSAGHDGRQLTFLLFAALVLAPLAEEALFRGFLQPVLRETFSRPTAIGATALIFALLHGNLVTLLPLFLFGLMLGYIYEWSGSLLLCIALHFWFNGITALLLLSGADVPT